MLGLLAQSFGFSPQKSIHPVGALAVSPSEMKSGRSSALLCAGAMNATRAKKPAAAPSRKSGLTPKLM
jgi:hypothetical protein